VSDGWIAIWDALEESERSRILAKLKVAAVQQAAAVKDMYASNFGNEPTVEILDCAHEGTALRVAYLFHWWEWCPAQSGSDWNYHRVYSGIAMFEGLKLRSNVLTERRKAYVHEYDEKSYDTNATLSEVRAELANSI
jgi:hypothetical protein